MRETLLAHEVIMLININVSDKIGNAISMIAANLDAIDFAFMTSPFETFRRA